MRQRSRALLVLLALSMVFAGLAGCEFRKGPDPTKESVEAPLGPFEIATTTVPAGHGFGGGTIYYPTDTSKGKFGGVAIVPGYTAYQSSISWYGPRVATQGFVVMTIDTNTTGDSPISRGDQLLAALDYLTTISPVAGQVDAKRLAVMGWSMGGGGSLYAAKQRPELKAAIPLAPWSGQNVFSTVTVPTMIVGCEVDNIAPVAVHAEPFYETLPPTNKKAYLEIDNGDHWCVASANTSIARSVISFLKRFVDGDTRYTQFLCPPPVDPANSEYRATCPYTTELV